MTRKQKKETVLGRGLDALISGDYREEDKPQKTKTKISEDVLQATEINDNIVEEVIEEVKKNPRISLWSGKSAAVLRFLRKTEPEFSISNEASHLIEKAVKEKYPEIWEAFEGRI